MAGSPGDAFAHGQRADSTAGGRVKRRGSPRTDAPRPLAKKARTLAHATATMAGAAPRSTGSRSRITTLPFEPVGRGSAATQRNGVRDSNSTKPRRVPLRVFSSLSSSSSSSSSSTFSSSFSTDVLVPDSQTGPISDVSSVSHPPTVAAQRRTLPHRLDNAAVSDDVRRPWRRTPDPAVGVATRGPRRSPVGKGTQGRRQRGPQRLSFVVASPPNGDAPPETQTRATAAERRETRVATMAERLSCDNTAIPLAASQLCILSCSDGARFMLRCRLPETPPPPPIDNDYGDDDGAIVVCRERCAKDYVERKGRRFILAQVQLPWPSEVALPVVALCSRAPWTVVARLLDPRHVAADARIAAALGVASEDQFVLDTLSELVSPCPLARWTFEPALPPDSASAETDPHGAVVAARLSFVAFRRLPDRLEEVRATIGDDVVGRFLAHMGCDPYGRFALRVEAGPGNPTSASFDWRVRPPGSRRCSICRSSAADPCTAADTVRRWMEDVAPEDPESCAPDVLFDRALRETNTTATSECVVRTLELALLGDARDAIRRARALLAHKRTAAHGQKDAGQCVRPERGAAYCLLAMHGVDSASAREAILALADAIGSL